MNKLLLATLLLLAAPCVPAQVAQQCDPYEAPVHAQAQSSQPGVQMETVRVWSDETTLYVQTTVLPGFHAAGWYLHHVYLHVSTQPPPMTSGVLLPGFFEYQALYTQAQDLDTVTSTFDKATLLGSSGCGAPIYISVYTGIRQASTNDALVGFAQGPGAVADANPDVVGYYWQHGSCCNAFPELCGNHAMFSHVGSDTLNPVTAVLAFGNDGDSLTIQVTQNQEIYPAAEGWRLSRVIAYIGKTPPTADPVTGVFLGQSNVRALFDYYPTRRQEYTIDVPLGQSGTIRAADPEITSDLTGIGPGDSVYVWINVGLVGVNSDIYGFANGPGALTAPYSTGWYWRQALCDDVVGPPPVTGCVKPSGYYKTHSALSKPKQQDPWPISESTLICGVSWYTALNTKSSDNWYKLASEWIGAMLNIGDGASTPADVDQGLIDADSLLRATCRSVPKTSKAQAAGLATLLSNYNAGLLEPAACPAP